MQVIWAERALIGNNWLSGVSLTLRDGRIAHVAPDSTPQGTTVDLLVPAPANCHSHAFQRAMAGLTEKRGPAADSFWTWRDLMFRFLDRITPEQVQAIAAFVQMEMLQAGYGASVEFHYLHHQPGGLPYANLAEMSDRICAAAADSGIGLTLLPVLYQFGGCDQRGLAPGQVRFGNDLDRFSRLVDQAETALRGLGPDAVLGVAPHSLRAVAREDLPRIAAMRPQGPVHMHLAEQIPEVDEVRAAWGARPVDWALENLPLDGRWCLIHCTQMTASETRGLAMTDAVAGLCPLTEASLGDGIFDGTGWLAAEGRLALGSDSNIRISLAEELRQLDTSQRLRDHSRAALASAAQSTGRRLLQAAAQGGAQAAGRGTGRIETGAWADLLALDGRHPDLEGLSGDTQLDSFAFAGDSTMVRDVWSGGRHLVQGGQHIRRDAITARYRAAVRDLRAGL